MELRRRIHTRFSRLVYSCAIGATHVADLGGSRGLSGPAPVLFFAPAQIRKRHQDWGAAELGKRLRGDWDRFTATTQNPSAPRLQVTHRHGSAALLAAYPQMLAGQADPRSRQTFTLAA